MIWRLDLFHFKPCSEKLALFIFLKNFVCLSYKTVCFFPQKIKMNAKDETCIPKKDFLLERRLVAWFMQVKRYRYMNLKKISESICKWNTKNVTNIRDIFYVAQDIPESTGNWNRIEVRDTSFIFFETQNVP